MATRNAVTKVGIEDLAGYVARDLEVAKRKIDPILRQLFEVVGAVLNEGGTVVIHGFGKFEPKFRAARVGRNPRTGEDIDIGAKRSPKAKLTVKLAVKPPKKKVYLS